MERSNPILPREANEELRRSIREGLKDGFFHPLSRHIYVFTPVDGGPRFASLFRETWKRVPLYARRRILKYWRTVPFEKHLVNQPPSIALLDGWSGQVRGRGLRGDLAVCSRSGCRIRFWSRIVAAMPDDLVCDLIAHELAHVDQWATGRNPAEEDSYAVEEDADRRAEQWGFSADGIDEWTRAEGITRVVDLEGLGPRQRRRYWAASRRAGR